jgi:hypothetical protein
MTYDFRTSCDYRENIIYNITMLRFRYEFLQIFGNRI